MKYIFFVFFLIVNLNILFSQEKLYQLPIGVNLSSLSNLNDSNLYATNYRSQIDIINKETLKINNSYSFQYSPYRDYNEIFLDYNSNFYMITGDSFESYIATNLKIITLSYLKYDSNKSKVFSKKLKHVVSNNVYGAQQNYHFASYNFHPNFGLYYVQENDTIINIDVNGNMVRKVKLNFSDTFTNINPAYCEIVFLDSFIVLQSVSKYYSSDYFGRTMNKFHFLFFDYNLNLKKHVLSDSFIFFDIPFNLRYKNINNSINKKFHTFFSSGVHFIIDTLYQNLHYFENSYYSFYSTQSFLFKKKLESYFGIIDYYSIYNNYKPTIIISKLDSNLNFINNSGTTYFYDDYFTTNRVYSDSNLIMSCIDNNNRLQIKRIQQDSLIDFGISKYINCDNISLKESSLSVLNDVSVTILSNSILTNSNQSVTIVDTSLVELLVQDTFIKNCLSAHYILFKDTFCINETPSLYSDTCVKYGISTWKISYPNDSDEWNGINYENINLKEKGQAVITHIHELAGCTDTFRDTIQILDSAGYNFLDLGNDTSFCSYPFSLKLNAYNQLYSSYLWQNGSNDSVFSVSDTGLYYVQVGSLCGTQYDTVKVTLSPIPTINLIQEDSIKICSNLLPYFYRADTIDSSYSYVWNNGYVGDTSLFSYFGTYYYTASNDCHTLIDSIVVIEKQNGSVSLPSIPSSISLCNAIYIIYRPNALMLEEKVNNTWIPRDSIILSAGEKKVFRYTDSCGNITVDSIYDSYIPSFTYVPNTEKVCETTDNFWYNIKSNITASYYSQNQWVETDSIPIIVGDNYIKQVDSCGREKIDTLVGYTPPLSNTNLIIDDSFYYCENEFPIQFNVLTQYTDIQWSTGDTTPNTSVYAGGTVYVTVSNGCNYISDSIVVISNSIIYENALKDSLMSLCARLQSVKIETDLVYPRYYWNLVESELKYYIADTSDNKVDLAIPRQCDTLRDRVEISWLSPVLPYPSYTLDTSSCDDNEPQVLMTLLNANEYTQYYWEDSIMSQEYTINSLKPIYFHAYNLCFDTIFELQPVYCPPSPIGLPSAFSPNGDKINDVWKFNGNSTVIQILQLIVYNRWGEKVYETSNNHFQWDGSYKGELIQNGVYRYYVRYESLTNHQIKELQGTVNVMY